MTSAVFTWSCSGRNMAIWLHGKGMRSQTVHSLRAHIICFHVLLTSPCLSSQADAHATVRDATSDWEGAVQPGAGWECIPTRWQIDNVLGHAWLKPPYIPHNSHNFEGTYLTHLAVDPKSGGAGRKARGAGEKGSVAAGEEDELAPGDGALGGVSVGERAI